MAFAFSPKSPRRDATRRDARQFLFANHHGGCFATVDTPQPCIALGCAERCLLIRRVPERIHSADLPFPSFIRQRLTFQVFAPDYYRWMTNQPWQYWLSANTKSGRLRCFRFARKHKYEKTCWKEETDIDQRHCNVILNIVWQINCKISRSPVCVKFAKRVCDLVKKCPFTWQSVKIVSVRSCSRVLLVQIMTTDFTKRYFAISLPSW